MRVRAVAILIEEDRLAMIERHRSGLHYYSFPGGAVEPDETPEDAVVREMEEETGLQVMVKRRIAYVWFRGRRQEFFLVARVSGEFGTGTGEEYQPPPLGKSPSSGTYHPLWLPLADLASYNVLPPEMAAAVQRAWREGWPEEPFEIIESVR